MTAKPETFSAFVEIDNHRMTRDELVLLGMKQAHEQWIAELRGQASRHDIPFGVARVLYEVADRMAQVRDNMAVTLTKAAIRSGSGKIEKIGGGNGN